MKEIILVEGEVEYIVWVGTNAKDNWNIIQLSEPDDIWFHIDNLPSAHVILRHRGYCSAEIVARCALLCRQSMKKIQTGKTDKKGKKGGITVISTEVANLTFGENVGMVHISKTANIERIRMSS
jgi:hypothetical protein